MNGFMFGGGYRSGADFGGSQAMGEAASARGAARDAQQEVAHLEDRFERLHLVTMAMWSLLEEKLGVTEEELVAKVMEIDLRDGNMDGKVTRTVQTCTACNRPVHPRHQRCLYCGHVPGGQSVFDGI
ncbi:MAG: hypothetical protein AAGJ38_04145 [Planctomycetota bacterium]